MLASFKQKLKQQKRSAAKSETPKSDVLHELDSVGLCALCRDLISQTILHRVELATTGAPSTHFADELRLGYYSCRLCQFARSIMEGDIKSGRSIFQGRVKRQSIYSLNPRMADYNNQTSRALLNFQTRYGSASVDKFEGNGTYALLHPEFANDELKPRHVKADSVDFALVKEWLQFCRDCHSVTCRPTQERKVVGLKLIDCQNRSIVNADLSFIYVALSYVWGTTATVEEGEHSFPATIEDSMKVVLNMGYRYLWVDKFCISQVDESERHHQISNMDIIYEAADLTIVAAAGDNPNYGLPGVSTRRRQQQRTLDLGTSTMVEIIDDRADIRKSAWASRAWTLQEGYLSRRRLIFTDHEVSFLCDNMFRQECVDQRLVSRGSGVWDGQDGSHLFGVIPNRNSYHFGQEQILHEYSGRKLSYSNDILNACLGILKAANVRHCEGIPLEMNPYSGRVIMNLQWANDKPGRRRPGFPSWSWTGSSGVKVFPEIMQQRSTYNQLTTISILADDWLTPFQWDKASATSGGVRKTQYIRITAPIARPFFTNPNYQSHLGHTEYDPYPGLLGEGPYMLMEKQDQHLTMYKIMLDVSFDTDLNTTVDPIDYLTGCLAVLLQPGSTMNSDTGTFEVPRTYAVMLILKRYGDRYRRVGISDWNNERHYTMLPTKGWCRTHERFDLDYHFKTETITVE
ncbi:heterokaryon incompatibility protein-domain-containing protein [Paraphoma chrysanthemicola]|uniref:Heterokaryon incompatibility protein-domain-containing protein n=1 Tax=Paraphoma chrysanthemicola TaxID=798071 RepID=A0A8K0R3P0_9PLEO|nr:heterokaryon incompatibility protein-domain-containing protein [Paraphoma chrysanthemicola]